MRGPGPRPFTCQQTPPHVLSARPKRIVLGSSRVRKLEQVTVRPERKMSLHHKTARARVDQHHRVCSHVVYLLRSKAKAIVSFIELT